MVIYRRVSFAQVRQTLGNISAILAEGGARPEHLVRLTWYVVDMEEYLVNLKMLGQVYRDIFGPHYPAHGAGSGRASRPSRRLGSRSRPTAVVPR